MHHALHGDTAQEAATPNDPATEAPVAPAPLVARRRSPSFRRTAGLVSLSLVSGLAGAAGALGTVAVASSPNAAAPAAVTSQVGPATGTTGATNDAAGDSAVIMAVAASASPAVVTIQVAPQQSNDPNDPFGQFQGGASGSGVVIDPSGLILTNNHVVSDANTVTVVLSDGTQMTGDVKGVDTFTDLALVKVDGDNLPSLRLGNSTDLKVGQLAIAIGSPLGQFPGSVTSGIVSGLDRTIDVSSVGPVQSRRLSHLIQTDAAINPGNSGGALLDGDGNLIGINTAEAGGAQGIGFAIPIDLAKPIITQVLDGKAISRPWIGIQYQVIDPQVAEDQNLDVTSGALIQVPEGSDQPAIFKDSPAAKADLKDGDIITAIDGQTIDATHPLDLALLQHAPGDTVKLTVLRNGDTQEIDVTLGERHEGLG
jgi:S1-C subfamily serine protease